MIVIRHELRHSARGELQDRAQEPEEAAVRHGEEALGHRVLRRSEQVRAGRPQDAGQPHPAPQRPPHTPEVLLHTPQVNQSWTNRTFRAQYT